MWPVSPAGTGPATYLAVLLRVFAVIALIVGSAGPAAAEAPAPWRISAAPGVPAWLTVELEHRTRHEHLSDSFRAASGQDATALSMRTLLSLEGSFELVKVGVEIQDSRAFATSETPLPTTIVNPLEVLQGYVELHGQSLLAPDDRASAKLGRFTMDVGKRRLVARNRYRNTINGFTGADLRWASSSEHVARAFAVMPVTRLPSDADARRDNEVELDEENKDAFFWGAFYGSPAIFAGIRTELYAYGLHERDGDVATSNRRIVTPGVRIFREPAALDADFELEAVAQLGTSRATKAEDDTDNLDHRAFFVHAEAGFSFDAPVSPRIAAQYDYASGDNDPGDDENNRFDTLFGARRFDFGPTGIYGPFARSNLSTPGLRLQGKPGANTDCFVAYRLFWLASATDAWTTTGLRDPDGDSGTFVGQQVEARVRLDVRPKNLRLELGGAYLAYGEFVKTAATRRNDSSLFVYTQVIGTI